MEQIKLTEELSQNFIDYAVAVNSDRSIPDAATGLKPVARRILWGAFYSGRLSSRPYVKNARIVGEVLGSWHVHGDVSIYGALTRLAQNWVMRYPLIDFHGNMGNIIGDGPAAMRYTEGRLAQISEIGILASVKKKTVPFIPNYDDTDEEPITLPAIFPNLLCNPNGGIGIAIGCNWASHNLREVEAAILSYLAGEEPMLPGPDFPTGGVVINKNDIPAIMRTGKGTVKICGEYSISGDSIIFHSVPYGTSIETILDQIQDLCEKNENLGITEVRDETDNDGVKIIIECHRDANMELIIAYLYAKTSLQSSFSYNQIALVNGNPTELNLKDCCEVYVNHNVSCIKKEAEYDVQKAKERLHIVYGLLKALEDIDNVITMIKKSENAAAAKTALMAGYDLSETQARAILDMKLSRLARLEKLELEKESKDLEDTVSNLNALIASEVKLKEELKIRLHKIVEKFGDDRRTTLVQKEIPKIPTTKKTTTTKKKEPEVAENYVVTVTESGLIKKIPALSFKAQKLTKIVKSQDDVVSFAVKTNSLDTLIYFTNLGRAYGIPVKDIPEGTNASRGVPINSIIKNEYNEKIVTICSFLDNSSEQFMVFVTKKGIVKKVKSELFMKATRKIGTAATKLSAGDELLSILFAVGTEDLMLVSNKGQAIRIKVSDVSTYTSKTTVGLKGISLSDNDDYVVNALIVTNKDKEIATFTEKGLGKKTLLTEFSVQSRGGKGVICHALDASTGNLAGAALSNNTALLVGEKSITCIDANKLTPYARNTKGVQVVKGKISSVRQV